MEMEHLEHMRKKGKFVVAALIMVVIGALLYNSGWSQGFALGVLTGGADGTGIAPYLAYRGGLGMFHGGFGFFGFIFHIGFVLLAIGFFAMVFRFARLRMYGGPDSGMRERLHEHWRRHHEPWRYDPWTGEPQQQSQPQPTQPAPSAPTGSGPDQPGATGPQPVSWIKV